MYSIPDMSYFAAPGFIEAMRRRPVNTASLILHNGNPNAKQWDEALRDESGKLFNSLHSLSGDIHDIYFPFLENKSFIFNNSEHVQNYLRPYRGRIIKFLEAYGESPDIISGPVKDWVEYLYANEEKHYKAAEFGANVFNLNSSELPCIILWSDVDNDVVIKILPFSYDDHMPIVDYIRAIYSTIIHASDRNNGFRPDINTLLRAIERSLNHGNGGIKLSGKGNVRIREISSDRIPQSVASSLREIGLCYKNYYDDAILAFEEEVKNISPKKSIIMTFTEKRKDILKKLRKNGFLFARNNGGHEIWQHPNLKKPTPVPRHTFISIGVSGSIMDDIRNAIEAMANPVMG